ncbi:MAG TPA: tRNA (adenosine(37)-N6)-threonylcarbamoyltransferase complex dimerization subunit type 1 TsaB [Polyangia bacterium]|nr:tRNA (adenosine(37)-N6)-threonylcarbamoyltransferase complex dimerization subunit type 1 TsaB [Polyangia bacterium]
MSAPTVLAVDTATLQAGVAVWRDGRVLAERRQVVTTHSESLLAMIADAFAEAGVTPAEVDAFACGAGPGSFTGLRIGLATVKGLCFATGKPLVMISSLAALAARAPDGRTLATLDALKGEVYAGLFDVAGGVPALVGAERVIPPARVVASLDGSLPAVATVVGSGAHKYRELVLPGARLLDEEAGPRPGDLARLAALRAARGTYDDLASAAPAYIRPSEAELVKEKRSQ